MTDLFLYFAVQALTVFRNIEHHGSFHAILFLSSYDRSVEGKWMLNSERWIKGGHCFSLHNGAVV